MADERIRHEAVKIAMECVLFSMRGEEARRTLEAALERAWRLREEQRAIHPVGNPPEVNNLSLAIQFLTEIQSALFPRQ